MNFLACLTSLFVLLATVYANTEKIIFRAPSSTNLASSGPSFAQLHLQFLTPKTPSHRLSLPVAFPTKEQSHGLDSWYLLRDLSAEQRHEVRVCWAATQPTSFLLEIHNISTTFDTPELIQSLAAFSEAQQSRDPAGESSKSQPADRTNQESLLFLRVHAAADFFASNKTLMSSPPHVDVDIILDPYRVNAIPRSLLPNVVYILALAAGAWVLSNLLWKRLFIATGKPHND
ncbi:hypothetical protein LTR53_007775 [Teratosphaeriaceae sp. CCFEE 6253]|nr:hypothetical protein LTR53_007775 [Teratosphaeriaceae sp. CCFEE 6253]